MRADVLQGNIPRGMEALAMVVEDSILALTEGLGMVAEGEGEGVVVVEGNIRPPMEALAAVVEGNIHPPMEALAAVVEGNIRLPMEALAAVVGRNIHPPMEALFVVMEEAREEVEEAQLPLLQVLYCPSLLQETIGHGLRTRWLRVEVLLEGTLLAAAEIRRVVIDVAIISVAEIDVAVTNEVVVNEELRAVGKLPNETPSAVRAHVPVAVLGKAPNGAATAATGDAPSHLRNQSRRTRIPRIRVRKKVHLALKRTAATRVRVRAHLPADHDRVRGMAYVVDVRVPILVPLL